MGGSALEMIFSMTRLPMTSEGEAGVGEVGDVQGELQPHEPTKAVSAPPGVDEPQPLIFVAAQPKAVSAELHTPTKLSQRYPLAV